MKIEHGLFQFMEKAVKVIALYLGAVHCVLRGPSCMSVTQKYNKPGWIQEHLL